MKYMIIMRAIGRLSLVQCCYQARRWLRDRVAKYWPKVYARRLARRCAKFPRIGGRVSLPHDLAVLIAAYYETDERALAAAAQGQFELLGTRVDFGSLSAVDWRYRLPHEGDHHLWRMKLCQLELLHSLVADGRDKHLRTAATLLDSFEHATGFDREEPFQSVWAPYGVSHRILAILSGIALAPTSLEPALEERLRAFVRRDAAFLHDNIEYELRNNHTERNLAALCVYAMTLDRVPASLSRGLDRAVRAIIRDTILADGMQVERSAMYQGLTVMALRIFAAADFLTLETQALASERAALAEQAWLFLSHADGDIALFNDSWTEEVPRAADIIRLGRDHIMPAMLSEAGYVRVETDLCTAWMDVGAIGPAWNPGHGHADFLSVEIDVHAKRFLVDPGTSQYSTGLTRAFERSAASHNGPCFRGAEPVEYLGRFKVGRMVAAQPLTAAQRVAALPLSTGGTLKSDAGSVLRVVTPLAKAGILLTDGWSHGAIAGAVRLLVPGFWAMERRNERTLDFVSGADHVCLTVHRGSLSAGGTGIWCRRYGDPERAHVIHVHPQPFRGRQASVIQIASGSRAWSAPSDERIEQLLSAGFSELWA